MLGYARASTPAAAGLALEAQRAAIRAECERRGWKLVRLEEEGRRGGQARPPGLSRALAALGAGEARALVVSRLDRLARTVQEAARLVERAEREGWNLVALDLRLDLSTPKGKRLAEAFSALALWERQSIAERTREALALAREQGVRLGTPRRTPAPVVEKISKLRAQGLSLQAIAEELNRFRVPTTGGGSRWRPSSVRSVLTRRS